MLDLLTTTVDINTARVIMAVYLVIIAAFMVMSWRDVR